MSFVFPENVNEPTHSTQFSFDESLLVPSFIKSPSLSNHGSNKSTKSNSDDVVEATEEMQQGCFMIVLKLEVDDKEEMIDQPSNLAVQWSAASLSHDFNHINYGSQKIAISDIEKVSKLHQTSASQVQSALNIDGVEQIGLQSLTLRISIKSDKLSNYFLIFDNYRTAFIWNTGLRTLLKLIQRKQSVTTIAFCCSPIDRINNAEIYDKMSINDNDETLKWIHHITSKLPSVHRHIARCHSFAEAACILDSSEHVSLLLATKAVRSMYDDSKRLAVTPFYQLTKEDITSLREVWMSLIADLTVAILKEHQLRNDMKASISSTQFVVNNKQFMHISK